MPHPSKRTAVLLTLSLAVNLALIGALLLRAGPIAPNAPSPKSSLPGTGAAPAAGRATAVVRALESGDDAAMRAAGVPLEVIHRLAAARAYARIRELERRQKGSRPTDDKSYWRATPRNLGETKPSSEENAENQQAQKEFTDAMRAAFGDDDPWGGEQSDSQYAFLPAATRDRVLGIEKDYEQLREQVGRDLNGVQLPSDEAKFKLLWEEQKRDVYAALSPEERAQFDLHVSGAAETVRSRWGDAIQSEADYKKIFALQKAFSAQFPNGPYADGPSTPEILRAREVANRQLEDGVRAIVGDRNYAELQRANDDSYRTLTALTTRLALPATTADEVYGLRTTYAARSLQINADASLSQNERREQLMALASLARSDVERKLGPEGAEAFAKSSNWIGALKNGSAFSTNRRDAPDSTFTGDRNQSIYTLPPKN